MQPTMKLRWLYKYSNEMTSHDGPFLEAPYKNKHCVLQQWWEEREPKFLGSWKVTGEWRDVPIETD